MIRYNPKGRVGDEQRSAATERPIMVMTETHLL